MATPGSNLEALANLQANKLQKIIESLQDIAASRTGINTPTAPQPPHIPTAKSVDEEAILWVKVSTGNVPPPEVPPIRPPPTHKPNPG